MSVCLSVCQSVSQSVSQSAVCSVCLSASLPLSFSLSLCSFYSSTHTYDTLIIKIDVIATVLLLTYLGFSSVAEYLNDVKATETKGFRVKVVDPTKSGDLEIRNGYYFTNLKSIEDRSILSKSFTKQLREQCTMIDTNDSRVKGANQYVEWQCHHNMKKKSTSTSKRTNKKTKANSTSTSIRTAKTNKKMKASSSKSCMRAL